MTAVEQILSDLSHKKLRDGSHEKWIWLRCFAGKCHGKPAREVIEAQLVAGKAVKAGYTCTQVRGYHDRWILVRSNPDIR